MARRFARLRPGSTPEAPGFYVVPDDGMCLSTFLVVERPGHPEEVLLGRLDPRADWFEIGSLTAERVAAIGDRWTLPSSQLLFFEGPEEAARRVLREQLDADVPTLPSPRVVSERYPRPGSPAKDPHWDLQFIYRFPWPHPSPPHARPWKELRFLATGSLDRTEIGRGHGDILELAGLSLKR